MRYGSVDAFRAERRLRPDDQIEAAWLEADAWFGATEGRAGDDATMASVGRRTVPRAQLAPRSRRRTSLTTNHAIRAITPSGIR